MRPRLLLLPLLLLAVGCHDSDPSPIGLIQTLGGKIGDIQVTVYDFLTGEAVEDAYVWIDSDTAGAVLSDSTGMAVVPNSDVDERRRMINAGKPGWSITSLHTTATTMRIAIVRTDFTGVGEVVTISGTVTFGTTALATSWEVFALESSDPAVFALTSAGFTRDDVSPAEPDYSVTVPTGREVTLVCAGYDDDGTLVSLAGEQLEPTADVTVDLVLGNELAPLDFGDAIAADLPPSHDRAQYSFGRRQREGVLRTAFYDVPLSKITSAFSTFDFTRPNPALLESVDLPHTVYQLKTINLQSNEFSFEFELGVSGLFDSDFPRDPSLLIETNSTGITPIMLIGSALQPEEGFHVVRFVNEASANQVRQWTVFTPAATLGFALPPVPAALANDGLVAGETYTITCLAELIGVFTGFDIFRFSATLDLDGKRRGYGDTLIYTPQ